jgi:HTH-type transcriptional regulator/antitoxin HipB
VRIVTATDLGALVRERRRGQSLSQEELARRVGVSRRWIIGLEQGQARAFELVLRTLAVLGLAIAVVDDDDDAGSVDLDELLSRYGPGP